MEHPAFVLMLIVAEQNTHDACAETFFKLFQCRKSLSNKWSSTQQMRNFLHLIHQIFYSGEVQNASVPCRWRECRATLPWDVMAMVCVTPIVSRKNIKIQQKKNQNTKEKGSSKNIKIQKKNHRTKTSRKRRRKSIKKSHPIFINFLYDKLSSFIQKGERSKRKKASSKLIIFRNQIWLSFFWSFIWFFRDLSDQQCSYVYSGSYS